jgi:hypothetical protein
MRFRQSLMLCAAAALVSAGCEHEHEHDGGPAALQGEVAVDEPRGAVIEGPGVEYIDVEPDPVQRVYVYDEGYPPGTYVYNNYYYYGGYRYPRDVFVNRYVQENVRQRRYIDRDENRREGQRVEQSQRSEFTKTRGVHQRPAARQDVQPRGQTPVRQPEAARPNVERLENRAPINQEHRTVAQPPANRPPVNEERRPAVERPVSPAPAHEERRPAVERPASPPPAVEHRTEVHQENRATPAREPAKPTPEQQRRDEGK